MLRRCNACLGHLPAGWDGYAVVTSHPVPLCVLLQIPVLLGQPLLSHCHSPSPAVPNGRGAAPGAQAVRSRNG